MHDIALATTHWSLKSLQQEARESLSSRCRLWVFAGCVPANGSRPAAAFAELLKHKGGHVELATASQLFEQHSSDFSPPDGCSFPVSFLKELYHILQQVTLYHADDGTAGTHLLLDMQGKVTSAAIELFLIADFPVFLLCPDDKGIQGARVFFKYCLLKLLDTFFDDKHPTMRAIMAELRENDPFSATIIERIKSLQSAFPEQGRMLEAMMRNFSPRLLLLDAEEDSLKEFARLFFSGTAVFPPSTSIMGALPPVPPSSACMIRRVHAEPFDGNHQKLETLLRNKMISLMQTIR